MNKKIAITGGIGSGKTTALKITQKLGYKTINADETYKNLLLNEDFVKEISSALNIEPIVANSKLSIDKEAISQLVFKDKEMLEKLNNITHPKVIDSMLLEASKVNGLVFLEVPLLYEGGFEKLFDYVFIIKREDRARFESASIRDGKSVEQIEKIAKNQFDHEKIKQNAHTIIIENNGDENSLVEKLKIAIENIKK